MHSALNDSSMALVAGCKEGNETFSRLFQLPLALQQFSFTSPSPEEMEAARRANKVPTALLNQLQLIDEFVAIGSIRAANRGSRDNAKSEKTQ